MGLSKSNRIILLLTIDSLFFLLEIVVGYAVHSLALVADSFHMLNDVLSLIVGLWAVRVANSSANSKMYTYGWQRAETLGALVNGVFLVALCLSILLDAIQRFVEPQEVTNPKLVLIVGSCGLASNILGLFLFHDHGHSHGAGESGHAEGEHDHISRVEQGYGTTRVDQKSDPHTHTVASDKGNVANVLPQTAIGAWQTPVTEVASKSSAGKDRAKHDEDDATTSLSTPTRSHSTSVGGPHPRGRRRTSASTGRGFGSVESLHVHPASFRNEIIAASRLEAVNSESDNEDEDEDEITTEERVDVQEPTERSDLLKSNGHHTSSHSKSRKSKEYYGESLHAGHAHTKPRENKSGGHGHSHGDLNMRGVFLHVMGDALGNIGVIASGLFIWLTTFHWRFYMDPLVSLVITCIILGSAIPLCKAASRILLQAVPIGMSIDDIRDDIEALPGVLGCHHLHVWQLSDTKHVASLHIQVDCDIRSVGSSSYMELARQVRACLHGYGIHSSTIQPEFRYAYRDHENTPSSSSSTNADTLAVSDPSLQPVHKHPHEPSHSRADASLGTSPKARSVISEPRDCLLDCGDNCGTNQTCCPSDRERERDKAVRRPTS